MDLACPRSPSLVKRGRATLSSRKLLGVTRKKNRVKDQRSCTDKKSCFPQTRWFPSVITSSLFLLFKNLLRGIQMSFQKSFYAQDWVGIQPDCHTILLSAQKVFIGPRWSRGLWVTVTRNWTKLSSKKQYLHLLLNIILYVKMLY